MKLPQFVIASSLASLLFVQASVAERGNDQRGRHGPPPEAIEACHGQSEGAACSFTGRNEEQLQGTCFLPKDRELACKPDDHDQRRARQNRQESN